MNGLKKMTGNKKTVRSLLVVATAAVLCVLILILPFGVLFPNLSGEKLYGLSTVSKQYLQSLDQDVEIVYYANGGKLYADRGLYRFVQQVAKQSGRIKLRLEDPERTGASAENHSILIRVGEKTKLLKKTDLIYYNSAAIGPISFEEYSMGVTEMQLNMQALQSAPTNQQAMASYQELASKYSSSQMSAYNMADQAVTTAIRNLVAEESPSVYAYGMVNSLFCAYLEQTGYTVTQLTSMNAVPEDCRALYLGMISDLTEAEAAALNTYLERDGKVFLTTDYRLSNTPNLSAILESYGMCFYSESNLICVISASQDGSSASIDHLFAAAVAPHEVIMNGLNGIAANYAHAIFSTQAEGVTLTALAASPAGSYLTNAAKSAMVYHETGNFPFCVLSEKGESAILWLGMSVSSEANNAVSGANFTMAKQSFDYFTGFGSHAPVEGISDIEIPSTYLALTNPNRTVVVWFAVLVIAIPLTVLTVGVVRRYTRKKRTE